MEYEHGLRQKRGRTAYNKTTLASHEHEINRIVYRLFKLTQDEIKLIESTLASAK